MSIARQNKIGNDLKKNGNLGGKEMQGKYQVGENRTVNWK